ncbi:MAG: helix-turn-helix domain-containing protein [Clostridia bacterium]|nr:helix-turn-helix domain-containing protein [Clostridia bacterium]
MNNSKIINKVLVGKRIKQARHKKGYTQQELAELVGISSNFLGNIERGQKLPSIDTLIKISNELKITLDSIFTDSLDNIITEPIQIYYTDRQLVIMRNLIQTINENF